MQPAALNAEAPVAPPDVVTAIGAGGESTNSTQASAVPLPSSSSTSLNFQTGGSQLQLAWPTDHIGWRLEAQTNSVAAGLGTNWFTVSGSAATNQISVPIDNAAAGGVFYRLAYP